MLSRGAAASPVTVRTLQYLLTAHGACLAVDGIVGAKTEAAAFYFQNRLADNWGTAVDGIVGPQTWQPVISNVVPRG